jgi:hypothetical protein
MRRSRLLVVQASAEGVTDEVLYAAMTNIVQNCKDPSARVYANAVQKHQLKGHALYHQMLYVNTNLGSWKGDLARSTKVIIKQWMKQNSQYK